MRAKKILSALTSLALSLSAFAGTGALSQHSALNANAATANWKFDFGGGGTASGYTGVSATEGYSSSKGYGFAQTGNVANVSAGGSGALSDAVAFNSDDASNTFNVDLPNGLYQVTVTTGNSPRTTIRIEGMVQMMNLTGNNATETIQIPVTDGQLNVQAITGMANGARTIAALEVTQINTTGVMKPTIWICGDSTVANYYNTADTSQHGWGQFLGSYVDTSNWEIRNQATSGQYAKGFYDNGQFAPIEYYGKTGDIYIISIGINDTNYSNATEYTEVVTTMVQKAKAKGMTVLLVKQQGRHGDLNRSPLLGGRWFGGQLDAIGQEQSVEVLDLFTAWQNFGISVGGYDAMTDYYAANDDLHQSKKGAMKLAELISGLYNFDEVKGEVMDENVYYSFKNVNSGLYMEVANASAESGANVQQWGKSGDAAHNSWKLKSAGDGYYYIYSALSDNLVLDVAGAKATDGQNVDIYTFNGNNNQQFKFTKNADGSYKIRTRVSGDKSAVEIINASTASGANVQQWSVNGVNCQDWNSEIAVLPQDGRLISGLLVLDKAHSGAWGIDDGAANGLVLFGDRDFTVDPIPAALTGAEQIITACESKNYDADLASFTAKTDITLYVALDTRVEDVPAWMSGFTKTNDTFTSSNDVKFAVYEKELSSGDTFTLGTNGQNYNCVNYAVFVQEKIAETTTAAVTTTAVAETTAEPVPTVSTTAKPKTMMGDANCDGKVTVADAVAILQSLGNADKYKLTAQGKINADVDGNIGVTAKDALFIQRVNAGLETLPDAPDEPEETTTEAPVATTTTAATTIAVTTTTDPYYYAVDQTWELGVAETVNAGYTREEGYVNLDNVVDSNITFTVNVEKDANYYVEIRMSNGKNDDRTMRVEVNGNTQEYWRQPFIGTDAWDNWKVVGIVLPLKAGENKIKFISETANGGPNLDYIRLAETDEPIAETFNPEIDAEIERQRQSELEAAKPIIYIAGDSTVQSYRASYAPQQGWGYYLADYFNDSINSVSNQAIAGRSSKSFYDQGRFDTIANSLKEGDFVLIQFAINDSASTNAERYAPVCGNVNNPTEGSYEWYMTQFITATQAKGATPILVTTTIGMKAYSNGKFVNSYTNYCDACKSLASKYNIPCIDLNTLMVNHYNSVGYDTAKSYHLMGAVEGSTDGTHFCEKGANIVAGLVAKAIKDQKVAGLYGYVK